MDLNSQALLSSRSIIPSLSQDDFGKLVLDGDSDFQSEVAQAIAQTEGTESLKPVDQIRNQESQTAPVILNKKEAMGSDSLKALDRRKSQGVADQENPALNGEMAAIMIQPQIQPQPQLAAGKVKESQTLPRIAKDSRSQQKSSEPIAQDLNIQSEPIQKDKVIRQAQLSPLQSSKQVFEQEKVNLTDQANQLVETQDLQRGGRLQPQASHQVESSSALKQQRNLDVRDWMSQLQSDGTAGLGLESELKKNAESDFSKSSLEGSFLPSPEGIEEISITQWSPLNQVDGGQVASKGHLKVSPKGISGSDFIATLNGLRKQTAETDKKAQILEMPKNDPENSGLGLNLGSKEQASRLELDVQVTSGAGSQPRLTPESVLNIGSGIRTLASKGGGEIRIRLRPDHLGELKLVISTQGSHVGIQIQASSEKAKRMIESNLASLKEGLSSQNLLLSQVDLTLMHAASNSSSNDQVQNQYRPEQNNSFQDMLGQSGNSAHQDARQNQSESGLSTGRAQESNIPKSMTARFGNNATGMQGRIDVKV